MSPRARSLVFRFYIIVTVITFLAVAAITVFEAHVRWSLNQSFSVLDDNGLASLVILLAAQMIGLVWLSKDR
jgi:hypothetical protein